MPGFDAFWWAKMTFIIYFEGAKLFVGSYYVRNPRIMEFTMENLSLWRMREEKRDCSQPALKASEINEEGMLRGWKSAGCFTVVH